MVTFREQWAEFSFFRPGARQVFLAGDFNQWQADDLPMVPAGNGYWTIKLSLPPGEFKFRYCADGQWFADYAAFGLEPGPYGPDSLVRVPDRRLRLTVEGRETGSAVAA